MPPVCQHYYEFLPRSIDMPSTELRALYGEPRARSGRHGSERWVYHGWMDVERNGDLVPVRVGWSVAVVQDRAVALRAPATPNGSAVYARVDAWQRYLSERDKSDR